MDLSGESCGVSGGKPCVPCIQLKLLDDKIKETATLLQRLLEQRHELKFERNHHHDQLIKRLPLELVSRIFTFCHPCLPNYESKAFDAFQNLRLDKEKSVATPWTLAVVCKSWKDVVWSTPQLWTSVALNTSHVTKTSYVEFAREWLSRSGELPLSLTLYESFYHHPFYIPEEVEVEKPLFDIINESSPRWKALNVCVSDHQLNYLSGDSSGTWMLEDLHFERFGKPDSSTAKGCIFSTYAKPTPKRISVCNVKPSNIGIGWDRLTHVDVSLFTTADCLEIFRHAHRMTHCTFHSVDLQVPQSPPLPQPIVHKSLQVFRHRSSSSLDSLFDSLTLPSLQELRIPTGCLSHATSLVTRSACRVTRLNVNDSGPPSDPEDHLIALLEQLPFLIDLTLSYAPISNTFFKRLGPIINTSSQNFDTGNVEEFLPVLRSLKVESPLWFGWKCVANMFASHPGVLEPPRRAMRSLKMNIVEEIRDEEDMSRDGFPWRCDPLPEDVVLRLLAVRQGGVKMWIKDDYGRDLLRISPDSD